MTRRIINAFRRLVLTRALSSLKIREGVPAAPLEPLDEPDLGLIDSWMFDTAPGVADHMADYSQSMGRLSGTLGRLHALVGQVAQTAPAPTEAAIDRMVTAVWADTLLFDGEPHEIRPALHADPDLFEEVADIRPDIGLQAALQLAPMESSASLSR